MMNFQELKRRFTYVDKFPLLPWRNLTNTPKEKPVGGDCEDWGWSGWVAEAGGVKNALIEMVTLNGIMWRCRSKYNRWWWPRHAVLQRKNIEGKWQFTDSSSKDWRDDIGENTRYYPAGTMLALGIAFAVDNLFFGSWTTVKIATFLLGLIP